MTARWIPAFSFERLLPRAAGGNFRLAAELLLKAVRSVSTKRHGTKQKDSCEHFEFAMILLIDHFDSFVHNLARYFAQLAQRTHVVRSNCINSADILAMRPDAVVLSPGPCTPQEAGESVQIVRVLHSQFPIFGVCLGQQIIATALGGRTVRADTPVHGRASRIEHGGEGLFAGLPSPMQVARYHSLVVEETSLPPELEVTARTPDGVVMAIAHRHLPVVGVQFHPESILTDCGYDLLRNFLRIAGIAPGQSNGQPSHESVKLTG